MAGVLCFVCCEARVGARARARTRTTVVVVAVAVAVVIAFVCFCHKKAPDPVRAIVGVFVLVFMVGVVGCYVVDRLNTETNVY